MFKELKLQIKKIDYITLSIGCVYLTFGYLKFFPNVSPAESLAEITISRMTFGWIEGRLSLVLLALLETTIGISFIFRLGMKWMIGVALFHMLCTFLPFFFDPSLTFDLSAHSLSITGQYILKNLIIISILLHLMQNRKEPLKA
ncbi:MAG: doxx family protein [Bacteroidetes bacterium]|nr:doxx family protein [Bacteroidota bacterium]